MKYLALALLLIPITTEPAVFDPTAFYVREVTEPGKCIVEGQRVSCAYLMALYNLMRNRCRECDWETQGI